MDLDGTLAHYEYWKGPLDIGDPVPLMCQRVVQWLYDGYEVRILTARVTGDQADRPTVEARITEWCMEHIGTALPITNEKDFDMIELWDDRAVQVKQNQGEPVLGSRSRL